MQSRRAVCSLLFVFGWLYVLGVIPVMLQAAGIPWNPEPKTLEATALFALFF